MYRLAFPKTLFIIVYDIISVYDKKIQDENT